jgi:hypothetical protein
MAESAQRQRKEVIPAVAGSDAGAAPEDVGEILARAFIALMREAGLPSGIAALG